jgi:formylglycine-generating enzyme required for sulfatase activity
VAAAVAVVLIIFSFVFWWPKRQEAERVEKQQPLKEIITKPLAVPEMVVIPAGSFRMGDLRGDDVYGPKDEVPVRTVKIEKRFAIGRYEVTFEEYDQFAMATKRKLTTVQAWGRGRQPVIQVKWDDAVNIREVAV